MSGPILQLLSFQCSSTVLTTQPCLALAFAQAAVFIPEDEPRLREGIRNWAIAFTRTLEAHLQWRSGCRRQLQH
eukprot:scaffold99827_cov14-Tisochrysis_lutea.AAC.1